MGILGYLFVIAILVSGCASTKKPPRSMTNWPVGLIPEMEANNKKEDMWENSLKKIQKGITNEQMILEWLGRPLLGGVSDYSTIYNAVISSAFPLGVAHLKPEGFSYPTPKENHKVIGYTNSFCVTQNECCNRGLLITIDKDTGIVAEFKRFETCMEGNY